MITPALVAIVLLWPALLPWLVAAGLPFVLAWWAIRHAKPVGWGAIELVERAARSARITRSGLPMPLTLVRMLLIIVVALAATRPFWGSDPLGERIVAGDPARRIELVTAGSSVDTNADRSSLAIRRAVEALAWARPDTIPAVDRVTIATAGRTADPPRLIILCDGAVPTGDDAARLAAAVRGGSTLLLCLGPESVALPLRTQVAAWLQELAGLSVAGSVSLDAEAIIMSEPDVTDVRGPPAVLAGPTVNRAADLVFGSEFRPAATVWVRSATTGRPLLVELPVAAGRVVVSALPLALPSGAVGQQAWSDLVVWPAFLPFIDRLVSRLTDPIEQPFAAITRLAGRFAGLPLARPLLACGGLLALLELILARRRTRAARLAFDALSLGGRFGLVASLSVMAAVWGGRPAEWLASPPTSPAVAVVIDVSPSMGGRDGGGTARLDRLMKAAAGSDAGNAIFDRMARDRPIVVHTVAEKLVSLGRYPADVSRADLRQLVTAAPAADASRIGEAVAAVLDRREGEQPAAVVIMSDGAITGGSSWAAVVALAARHGVPLVVVPIGDDAIASATLPTGFRLTAAAAPTICRRGETISIPVHGVASAQSSQPLPLRSEGGEAWFTAAESPTASGYDYTCAGGLSLQINGTDLPAPKQPGDSVLPVTAHTIKLVVGNNNDHVATLPVVVADDPIRVLLVDHGPRFEYRFLTRLLASDPRYAVTTRLLAARDIEGLRAEASLPQSVKEWSGFDVVVLGDLPIEFAATDAPAWDALQEAVASKGVGVAWLPGRRWAEADAGIVGWLPAVPAAVVTASEVPLIPRRLRLLPSGWATGWLSFVDGAGDSTAAFAPRTFSPLPPFTLPPLARVIAVTETDAGGNPQPAIVASQMGQGIIVGHLCDTWRWQGDPDATDHARYWLHLLPRLAERRRLGRLVAATIAVRPLDPLLGEPVRVDLMPTRPTTDLTGWTLAVEASDHLSHQIKILQNRPGSVASLQLDGLAAGRHQLTLVPPTPTVGLPTAVMMHEIVVNEWDIEAADGPAGTGPLREATAAGGGAVVPLDQIDTLPDTIERVISGRRTGGDNSLPWLASQSAAHLVLAAFVLACAVAWWPRLNPRLLEMAQ